MSTLYWLLFFSKNLIDIVVIIIILSITGLAQLQRLGIESEVKIQTNKWIIIIESTIQYIDIMKIQIRKN